MRRMSSSFHCYNYLYHENVKYFFQSCIIVALQNFSVKERTPNQAVETQANSRNPNLKAETQFNRRNPNFAVG